MTGEPSLGWDAAEPAGVGRAKAGGGGSSQGGGTGAASSFFD